MRSSTLGIQGTGTERLVQLVKAVGGTGYLSGEHATRTYLDPALFAKAGLELWALRWSCPEFEQVHPRAGFVPDLAIVDLLFSRGQDSRGVLDSGSTSRAMALS